MRLTRLDRINRHMPQFLPHIPFNHKSILPLKLLARNLSMRQRSHQLTRMSIVFQLIHPLDNLVPARGLLGRVVCDFV